MVRDHREDENVDVATKMANLIAPLSLDEIERMTIDAIREHRAALAKAEAAYDSWKEAQAAHLETVTERHKEYTRVMLAATVQQMVLATLIERLGFIPRVPPD
ncbi:hypothetical protein AFEL58S_00204 [Afipia felis]